MKLAERVTEPLLTCEAVLAETGFHFGSTSITLAFVTKALVRPALVLGDHLARLAELAERDADREPNLTDLCVRFERVESQASRATTDLYAFRIHPRGRREAIALVHPPA